MSPETERALVALAMARGLVTTAQVAGLEQESRRAAERGQRTMVARLLVDRGVLGREVAAGLLLEVRGARARAPGAVSNTLAPRGGPLAIPKAPPLAIPPPSRGPARGVQVLGPGSELGPYQLTGELGRGGMGVVYRALDRRLGREVAIKTISGLADEEAVERFVREARAAARLRHPGVVQVLEAGTLSGVCFVALELVSGGSLQKRLEKGPLAPNEAAALVRDLALAVHSAHLEGIVHRDLKPANVLLEPVVGAGDGVGRPRLTDFGLARDDTGASLTEAGVALGTPAYMAPEQANADKAAIGPRTDVYGLGAVLYHALTGSAPFQGGGGLAIMHKVLTEDVESPSRRRARAGLAPLAPDLETICLKALEKKPGARYESAEALSQDLARSIAGEATLARPVVRLERWLRLARRHRGLVVVALLGLLGTVGGASAVWVRRRSDLLAEQERNRNAQLEALHALEVTARAGVAALVSLEASSIPRGKSLPAFVGRERILGAAARALVEARTYARATGPRPEAQALLREVAMRIARLGHRVASVEIARLGADEIKGDAEADREVAAAREAARCAELAGMDLSMAVSLHEAGRGDLALKAIERALAKDPSRPETYLLQAKILNERGDLTGALAALDRGIAADPASALGWGMRSELLARSGRDAEAETAARRAVDVEPASVDAWLSLAQVLRKRGEFVASQESLEHGAALDPTSEAIEAGLGEVHMLQHHTAEGIAHFVKAVELELEPGLSDYELAQAYLEAGNREKAKAALRPLAESPLEVRFSAEGRRLLAKLEGR